MDKARRALQISILLIATVFFASTAYATCSVSNCKWSTNGPVTEGTSVTMSATFSGCSGTVYYDIYEDDAWPLADDYITEKSVSSPTSKTWTTVWTEDAYNFATNDYDPEYYFELYVGSSYKCSSGDLKVVKKVCTPSGKYCDGGILYTCNSAGSGWTSKSCSPYNCASSMTACQICSPGSKRCNGDSIETCNSGGTGWDGSSCTYGCSSGACKPKPMVCIPSTYWCDGSARKKCSSDGYTVSTVETCTYGCDSSTAKCLPQPKICTPYEKKCSGSTVQTCSSDGYSWSGSSCQYGCSSNACNSPPPCTASNCRWSASDSVEEGINVNMLADFSGECSGKTVNFDIYENDVSSPDDYTTSKSVTYGSAASWTTSWTQDCILGLCGNPEYYFELTIGGTNQCTSADLGVSKKQMICSPDSKICDGDVLKTCASDGYSWDRTTCTYGCGSGACKPQLCTPTNCRWSTTGTLKEGTAVNMLADFSGECSGKTIDFNVYESDVSSADDLMISKSVTYGNPATWETSWTSDCILGLCGNPEYYFELSVDGNTCSSPDDLNVIKPICTPGEKKCDGDVLQTCSSDGYSWDGSSCTYGCDSSTRACMPNPGPCVVSNCRWSIPDQTTEGTELQLQADFSGGCKGKEIRTDIYEDDLIGNDFVTSLSRTGSGPIDWTTIWTDDGGKGCPEYFFNLYMDGEKQCSSKILEVTKPGDANEGCWNFGDAILSCVWTGDYQSTTEEITCNVAPIAEIFPDVRDSLNCFRRAASIIANEPACLACMAAPTGSTCTNGCSSESLGTLAICSITWGAAGYDAFQYGTTIVGAIFGAGFGGVAGYVATEPADVVLSSLKAAGRALGSKIAGDALATVTLAPNLMKLVWRAGKKVVNFDANYGKIFIKALSDGADASEAFFKIIDEIPAAGKLSPEGMDALRSIFKKTGSDSPDVVSALTKLVERGEDVAEPALKMLDGMDVAKLGPKVIDGAGNLWQASKAGADVYFTVGGSTYSLRMAGAGANVPSAFFESLSTSRFAEKFARAKDALKIDGEIKLKFFENKNAFDSYAEKLGYSGKDLEGLQNPDILGVTFKDSKEIWLVFDHALDPGRRTLFGLTVFHEMVHLKFYKIADESGIVLSDKFMTVNREFFADYVPIKMFEGEALTEATGAVKTELKELQDAGPGTVTLNIKVSSDEETILTHYAHKHALARAVGDTEARTVIEDGVLQAFKDTYGSSKSAKLMDGFLAHSDKLLDKADVIAKNIGYVPTSTKILDILKSPPTEWVFSPQLILSDYSEPTQDNGSSDSTSSSDTQTSDSSSSTGSTSQPDSTGSTGTAGGGQTSGTQANSSTGSTGTTGGGQTESNQTSDSTGTTGTIGGGQTGGTQPSCPPNTICGGEIGGDGIGGGQIGGGGISGTGQTSAVSEPVCTTNNVCKTVKSCHTKRYGFLKLFKKKVCDNVQVCTPTQVCK